LGEADPVASNATESGRAQNRRVVVSVANASLPAMAPVTSGNVPGPVAGIPACEE